MIQLQYIHDTNTIQPRCNHEATTIKTRYENDIPDATDLEVATPLKSLGLGQVGEILSKQYNVLQDQLLSRQVGVLSYRQSLTHSD